MALLYPNIYPVAISNLGFQLVYSLLNQREDLVCERFVYPEPGGVLRSLESSRPLTDFPLVLASISFEHDYPRIAAMLASVGIEPFAAQRPQEIRPGNPLVVFGGIAVSINPEPLAPFADLMIIGEAEPVLDTVMDRLAGWLGHTREDLLPELASTLPGCYVPGLYSFSWQENGAVEKIEAAAGLPARVSRVYARSMQQASHSTLQSPLAELDMYMVELGRGCSRGCRFCAAGFVYRPPRLWSAEAVLASLAQRSEHCKRVGLLGMEMAEEEVIAGLAQALRQQNCNLSFSSLRADRINGPVLPLLAASELKTATLGVDGCSQRLRRLINKGISEEDLLAAAVQLVEAGIVHLKLYVMIGFPHETRADLEEFVRLVGRLQQHILPLEQARGHVCSLSLSINCFVPKPWTPLQYCAFGGLFSEDAGPLEQGALALVALKEKIRYLRKELASKPNLRLKWDHPEQALQQAVFARADRRLAPVILDLGRGGFSFKQVIRRHNIDLWQYAFRWRKQGEVMCWEVVDHGIHSGYLWEEYKKALDGNTTRACEPASCRRCGVCAETVGMDAKAVGRAANTVGGRAETVGDPT